MQNQADRLASGQLDPMTLQRKLIGANDNMFGSVNYAGWNWSNAARSAMQLVMMAPGWAKGFVNAVGEATSGQIKEFTDPIKQIEGPVTPGEFFKAYRNNPPRLDPAMRLLLGAVMGEVTLRAIMQKRSDGTFPWETDTPIKDSIFPRSGGNDENGHPNRYTLPGATRTLYSLTTGPARYLTSTLNPPLRRTGEVLAQMFGSDRPKFYDGGYVWDPDETITKKFVDGIRYWATGSYPGPKDIAGAFGQTPTQTGQGPIWTQNIQRLREQGKPLWSIVGGIFGLGTASKHLDDTQAEEKITDLRRRMLPEGGAKPGDVGRNTMAARVQQLARQGSDVGELLASGDFSPGRAKAILRDTNTSQYQSWFGQLTLKDALVAWDLMGNGEKQNYLPLLMKKREGWRGADPSQQQIVRDKWVKAISEMQPQQNVQPAGQ